MGLVREGEEHFHSLFAGLGFAEHPVAKYHYRIGRDDKFVVSHSCGVGVGLFCCYVLGHLFAGE